MSQGYEVMYQYKVSWSFNMHVNVSTELGLNTLHNFALNNRTKQRWRISSDHYTIIQTTNKESLTVQLPGDWDFRLYIDYINPRLIHCDFVRGFRWAYKREGLITGIIKKKRAI